MISSLITKAPAHVQIIEMLSSAGRGELLWALTQFGDDRVRVLSLKVCLVIVHFTPNGSDRFLCSDTVGHGDVQSCLCQQQTTLVVA